MCTRNICMNAWIYIEALINAKKVIFIYFINRLFSFLAFISEAGTVYFPVLLGKYEKTAATNGPFVNPAPTVFFFGALSLETWATASLASFYNMVKQGSLSYWVFFSFSLKKKKLDYEKET